MASKVIPIALLGKFPPVSFPTAVPLLTSSHANCTFTILLLGLTNNYLSVGAAAIGVQLGVIPFLEFAGLKGEIPTLRTGNCKNVEALHACEGETCLSALVNVIT